MYSCTASLLSLEILFFEICDFREKWGDGSLEQLKDPVGRHDLCYLTVFQDFRSKKNVAHTVQRYPPLSIIVGFG